MTRPFMTDPELLASLEGQQYLVLRPIGEIAAFYRREQTRLRDAVAQPLTHPNAGHVTLRGFSEPDRIDKVRKVLTAWSTLQAPLFLHVEAIDGFPPPFQVLIARLQRTDQLIEAYSNLTRTLEASDLNRIGELTVEEWVFHLSLIYASTLNEAEWHYELEQARRFLPNGPSETVLRAKFVWYDHGVEHRDVLPLGGS